MIEVSASLLFGCSTVSTPLPAIDKSSVYSVKIPPPPFFFSWINSTIGCGWLCSYMCWTQRGMFMFMEWVQLQGRFSFICTVWANCVSTWTEKLQMQSLCHLSCQGWTTATVVWKRTSYWDYSKSSTLLQELSLKQRGQITSLPFSVSYTGYLLICVLTTKSCLVYSCKNGTALQYLQELIPHDLPVRHPRSSTQYRLRIPSVNQGNNKKLFGVNFPMLHPNCGAVCPLLWESIIRRKLLRKTWRPTCSQRIRFA